MIAGARLLVVDEQPATDFVDALRGQGLVVHAVLRATDALVEYGCFSPDALLVAPRLPDLDLGTFVGAVRRRGDEPILLGVGSAGDLDEVGTALLAGATGTVSRPYAVPEIVAKVAATLRSATPREPLRFGPLRLDPLAHSVHLGDRELGLGIQEFRLLQVLLARADRVVSHLELRDALADDASRAPSSNAIAVQVRRLRARLSAPIQVRTVRGLGYRLTLDP